MVVSSIIYVCLRLCRLPSGASPKVTKRLKIARERTSKRYIFRPKRTLYAVVRRKNGRRSSDICQGYYGGPTTELVCWCTYEISPTIFVQSGRSKGAIPNISRDRGEPLSFRPNTEKESKPNHHNDAAKVHRIWITQWCLDEQEKNDDDDDSD